VGNFNPALTVINRLSIVNCTTAIKMFRKLFLNALESKSFLRLPIAEESDAYSFLPFLAPIFAAYFRSRVDDGTEGLILNRDNASPRFWMNASD
jgi:hypothetical protein